MSHFLLSLLDSSFTRSVLGMHNQASLFNGTRVIAIRPSLFPRVPRVMEKATATRIGVLRPLRTVIKHKNQSEGKPCSIIFSDPPMYPRIVIHCTVISFLSRFWIFCFGPLYPGAVPTGQAQWVKGSNTALQRYVPPK